ncbi:unnamed protein product, partial [Allacma fusca]
MTASVYVRTGKAIGVTNCDTLSVLFLTSLGGCGCVGVLSLRILAFGGLSCRL